MRTTVANLKHPGCPWPNSMLLLMTDEAESRYVMLCRGETHERCLLTACWKRDSCLVTVGVSFTGCARSRQRESRRGEPKRGCAMART